jgi:hypothetical protein
MPWRAAPDAPALDGFVPVELTQVGPRTFELRADLVYVDRSPGPGGGPRTSVVPAGFRTDLASVPFPLWALIGPFGRQTRAAILHDHDCQAIGPPARSRRSYRQREAADHRFRDALLDSGVPPLRAWLMWAGVSVGRVVVHGSWPLVVALLAQLALALVLFVAAVVALDGWARWVALAVPLVLSAPWGRAWRAIALVQYAGALVVPAIVVNVVTGALLTVAGLPSGGRPADIVPTRVRGD